MKNINTKKKKICQFPRVTILFRTLLMNIIQALHTSQFPVIVKMSATGIRNPGVSFESTAIKLPSHPTYDLKSVVKLALAEDAGDRGSIQSFSCFQVET